MVQKTVKLDFKRAAEAILPRDEEGKLITDAGSWGPKYSGMVKDLLNDALEKDKKSHGSRKGTPKLDRFTKTVVVLRAAQKTQIQVPDGKGGITKPVGDKAPPNNSLGPVLLHLHLNPIARDDAKHKELMSQSRGLGVRPYYVDMNLLELNHHIADGGMLKDYCFLLLHHSTMTESNVPLPFYAADAVLRNGWGAGEVSRLQESLGKYGKAYEKMLGFRFGEKRPGLTYNYDETPILIAFYEGEDHPSLAFNAGSNCFTAGQIEKSLDYELPATCAMMLAITSSPFDKAVPVSAFQNGGTRIEPSSSSAGITLPEADFEALRSMTGLGEEDLGNFLQTLVSSKLGLEFAGEYLEGRESESPTERREAFMHAFTSRISAREESRDFMNQLSPDDLRRHFDGNYGKESTEKLRWDVTIQAVYAAILSEHEGQCGNGPLQEQCRDRRETVTNRAAKFMQALSEPYDFGGAVDEFRKIHRGIQLLEKTG